MIDCSIKQLLSVAKQRLQSNDSALIDAQLLMQHALQTSREVLLAWPERQLNYEQLELFEALVCRRERGEPIAYITGHKAFWTLELRVSPAVLIPRPETELLIEWVLENYPRNETIHLADLGTGSGAIALAIASERPHWQITATDISTEALSLAIENAELHQIKNVSFCQGSWCKALPEKHYDLIISNPPYIAPTDPHLLTNDLQFEPQQALVANQHGLADLQIIAEQSLNYLKPKGALLLEHGFEQGSAVRQQLATLGYQQVETLLDLAGLERATFGSVSMQETR